VGADIHDESNNGRTAVHIASHRGNIQCLIAIADKCTDFGAVMSHDWTAAHFPVMGNFQNVCRFPAQWDISYGARDVNKAMVYDLEAK
jgi:hypothetical protein